MEQARRIDKGVAMERSEAHKFRVLEAGNHPQHPALLRIGHLGLETDHVVEPPLAIVLAELYHGIGTAAVAIAESDWAHRTEGERLLTAPRHLLDRHAPLEIDRTLEFMQRHLVRGDHGGNEGIVGRLIQWTVDIVVAALAVA